MSPRCGLTILIAALALASCSSETKKPPEAYADAQSFRPATLDDAVAQPFTHTASGRTYQLLPRDGNLFLRRSEANAHPVEKQIH